jgi:hypothetical protein
VHFAVRAVGEGIVMGSVRWARWGFPLLAGLALVASSVACGAGQFRLRSAGAEPVVEEHLLAEQAPPPVQPTLTLSPERAATAAPTLPPAPTAVPIDIATVQVQALRVRAGPSTQHSIIVSVKLGQQLEVLGQNDNGSWLQVKFGDVEGWVAAEFVTVSAVVPTPEATEGLAPGGTHPVMNAPDRGLGVPRRNIQTFYEELGFAFTAGKTAEGQELLTGVNHTQQATIVLVGPEIDLAAASMTAITRYDQETMVLSVAYLLGFVSRVLPGWVEGPSWIEEHLREAKNGIPVTASVGPAGVRLTGSSEAITLSFATQ